MKKIVTTTIFTMMTLLPAYAQEPAEVWTLNECMQYAVENSPAVRKQQFAYNSYQADRDRATASFFPSASASIGAQYNFGRSIDPETNTYNNTTVFSNSYGLNTSIPIFQGGQLVNQLLMSHSNVRMGRNDIRKEKDELALQTMQAFMDVVYYQQTRRLAAEKLQESSRTLYKTRRQEEIGLKSRADVVQFEAQVAADDYTLTQQENLFNTALLTLKQCMNFPINHSLEVDTLLASAIFAPQPAENADAIFLFASGNNPTALQADFKLRESEYLYRIYKGRLLPTISFNAGISTNYIENLKAGSVTQGFGGQFKNNRGEYLSFNFAFPLFDGLYKVTQKRRYHNNLRMARETKTEVMRQLQNAIEQAILDREGYAKEAIQIERKVESDELAYQITLRKYEEGLMSTLDVQTNANNLLTSRAELLQKRLMYHMKCKLINYYKGEPLIDADESN